MSINVSRAYICALFSALCVIWAFSNVISAHADSTQTATKSLNNGSPYLLKVTGVDGDISLSGAALDNRPWIVSKAMGHAVYKLVTGLGQPVVVTCKNGGNQPVIGTLVAVAIPLSSDTAQSPRLLDTLQIPVTKQVVSSNIKSKKSQIYLICALGDARTGGGGLGRGDAEYMDYKADGTGNEDIGDANTDYGIGIDDLDGKISPRKYKWGLWRQDHTYSTLYVGTGKLIKFLFFDSYYADNSPTDTLTVSIYAVP
jgi:hypothetical protein